MAKKQVKRLPKLDENDMEFMLDRCAWWSYGGMVELDCYDDPQWHDEAHAIRWFWKHYNKFLKQLAKWGESPECVSCHLACQRSIPEGNEEK